MIAYLASPYSHRDPDVMAERYRQTCEAAAMLFRRGHMVYSPIAHTVAVNEVGGLEAHTFDFWQRFDLDMIDRLDELWVLMLPGWVESRGVAAEIDYATDAGMTVRYLTLSGSGHVNFAETVYAE